MRLTPSFTPLLALLLCAPLTQAFAENATTVVARKTLDLDAEKNLRLLTPNDVNAYEEGYQERDGGYVCDAGTAENKTFGVRYAYRLDQTVPTPLIAKGWSKAENVGGNIGSDYSLYLDISYADGTSLWGQVYNFPVGDSDWSEGKVAIFPTKPVKWVSFYGMFRGHSGQASFKDLALYEYDFPSQVALFDGNPVEILDNSKERGASLYLRDVAKKSDYLAISDLAESSKNVQPLGLTVSQKSVPLESNVLDGITETSFVVENVDEQDKALSLVYAIPFPNVPEDAVWVWFEDPRRSREVDVTDLAVTRSLPEVGAGRASRYPFGVVAAKNAKGEYVAAFGLAIDPEFPAFYRVACNGGTNELYIAFDFALTKEKPTAEFRVLPLYWSLKQDEQCVTPISAELPNAEPNVPFGSTPFRAAFDVYRQAFPKNFAVRAIEQGNWMAFAKISKVPNWQDFGFQFKEGIDEIGADDEKNITTFRYTEPMTWWQQVAKSDSSPKSIKAAYELAKKQAIENAKNENGAPLYGVEESRSLLTSGFKGKDGKPYGMLLDTPWCDGVVWSLNDAPGLVELARQGKLRNSENAEVEPLAGFEVKWSDKIADQLYGATIDREKLPQTRQELIAAQATPGCDGEYVDSSEGYVTAMIDFDRAHFAGMQTPLVYDFQTLRPGILRGLIAYEYVKKISDDVHARAKLSMANATPDLHFWLTTQLDVVGTETNWNWGGGWRPMPDPELLYRRVMTCGKPYCFLMNTDFSQFSHEACEKYMKRALAYGMFPSMFSADASTKHYFENPDLYERDRDLFKKYMPIVTAVAEQGWEPETGAVSNDDALYLERFGALRDDAVASNALRPNDAVYLTLFNDSEEEKEYEITLGKALLRQLENKSGAKIVDPFDNTQIAPLNGKLSGKIGAQDVRVFKID